MCYQAKAIIPNISVTSMQPSESTISIYRRLSQVLLGELRVLDRDIELVWRYFSRSIIMSGIEIIGLVLGAILLISSGLKSVCLRNRGRVLKTDDPLAVSNRTGHSKEHIEI